MYDLDDAKEHLETLMAALQSDPELTKNVFESGWGTSIGI